MFSAFVQLGPFRLPTYATLLSLGLSGGILLSMWQGVRRGFAPSQPFDAALVGAVGSLVGARATYVAVNWAYYGDHLSEAFRFWTGGLAWQGGLSLGLLLVALYGVRFRLSMGALFDSLALGLAWFTLFIWLGSGSANDVYGRETFPTDGLLWTLSADLPDLYGLRAPRINVSLLGSVWSGLVLVASWLLRGRLSLSGSLFLATVILIGLGGLLLVPLQASQVPYLLRVRLDWLFNLLLVISGLVGWIIVRILALRYGRQSPSSVSTNEARTRES